VLLLDFADPTAVAQVPRRAPGARD
jgi:hypothetical protein